MKDKYNVPIEFLSSPQPCKINFTGSKDYLVPLHAAIELTYKCNLKCKHCYIESDMSRNETMPLEKAKKILKELKQLGIRTIELTGGEPTLHPSFFEILNYSYDLDFDLIGLLTNGTLLNEELISYIAEHKDKIIVQIDLHGSKREYVEWFTGKTFAFDRMKTSIAALASKGVIMRVVASITPLNIDQMDEIAKIAKDAGVFAVGFAPIVPMGRAIQESDKLLITEQSILLNFSKKFKNLKEHYGSHFIFSMDERNNSSINCGTGTKSITISPLGFIKLCQMASQPLSMDSLFYKSLEGILKENKTLFLSLVNLPSPSPSICSNCENLWFCENCILRGIIKAKEKKEDCMWFQKQIKGTFLEKLLF